MALRVTRAVFISSLFISVPAELHVRCTGIGHIDRFDVGMVFFVEIENVSKFPVALDTRMINCCENITPEDIDCEHIQLIGGEMGVLNSRGIRNVTLIWPTLAPSEHRVKNVDVPLSNPDASGCPSKQKFRFIIKQYLHERKGGCHIAISYTCRNKQTGEIQAKVRFDTSVSKHEVPPVLEGYYEPRNVKKCASVDLDPLDRCRPINCHVKYNGKRNFYNRKLQRCQPVPICVANSGKELPDVAYVPVSNTCRDLENAVNEVEIHALKHGEAEPAWASEPAPRLTNMYCHRGYNDNATGFCICDEGWTSQPHKIFEPSTEYIHMCNVQITRFPNFHGHPIEILLIIIAAFLGTLVVVFCCAMTFLLKGFGPPGTRVDCGQQTGGLDYFETSTKSLSCCSSNNSDNKQQKVNNRNSSTSCPRLR